VPYLIPTVDIHLYISHVIYISSSGNAFNFFPRNNAMVFGVAVMFIHQMIAYILFMMPVFHIAEKAFGVHESTYIKKVAARLVPGWWMTGVLTAAD
jgi:hypothetical protein